ERASQLHLREFTGLCCLKIRDKAVQLAPNHVTSCELPAVGAANILAEHIKVGITGVALASCLLSLVSVNPLVRCALGRDLRVEVHGRVPIWPFHGRNDGVVLTPNEIALFLRQECQSFPLSVAIRAEARERVL